MSLCRVFEKYFHMVLNTKSLTQLYDLWTHYNLIFTDLSAVFINR